jgi:hypothetical protein
VCLKHVFSLVYFLRARFIFFLECHNFYFSPIGEQRTFIRANTVWDSPTSANYSNGEKKVIVVLLIPSLDLPQSPWLVFLRLPTLLVLEHLKTALILSFTSLSGDCIQAWGVIHPACANAPKCLSLVQRGLPNFQFMYCTAASRLCRDFQNMPNSACPKLNSDFFFRESFALALPSAGTPFLSPPSPRELLG